MSRLFPFAFLLVLVLIAGAYFRSIADEPAISASEQALAVSRTPTITALVTVTASPSATPFSTPTPTPSSTPLPDPTNTPPATVTVTPTATNTRFPTPTPDPEGYNYRYDLPSPDGQWVATYKRSGIGPYPDRVILTVTNVGNQEQVIVENLIEEVGGEGIARAPHPFTWSLDSQTLYYTYRPTYGDGCDPYDYLTLHAYSLVNRTHQTLLSDLGEAITFSPTQTKVAYFPHRIEDGGLPLFAIYDMQTGTLNEVPLHEVALFNPPRLDVIGQILWHPNEQIIVLSLISEPCVAERPSLILVDVATMEQTILTVGGPRWYSIEGWSDDNQLIINEGGKSWIYNLEMGYWFPISNPE